MIVVSQWHATMRFKQGGGEDSDGDQYAGIDCVEGGICSNPDVHGLVTKWHTCSILGVEVT